MASNEPLNVDQLAKLFDSEDMPSLADIRLWLNEIANDYVTRAVQLKEVASGFRFQVSSELTPWIQKLWQERPAKYSRATLETLALIIYKQPITRAEIEEVRGVSVSSTILKALIEREWIKIIGYKEVPGKPALYATTKQFLNDVNLISLTQLPPLSDLQDFEELERKLTYQLQDNLPSEPLKKELIIENFVEPEIVININE